jgi:hypothetical protein
MISDNIPINVEGTQPKAEEYNQIPARLKKTFYVCIALFVMGIVLLIIAIEEIIRHDSFWDGSHFLVLFMIVFIPGCYYTIQFIRAKFAKDIDTRIELYDNIPELG